MMDVVLYSTGCPRCEVLKKKLIDSGIDFEVVNNVEVMEEKGITSAPGLEVDGRMMDFGKAVKWLKQAHR